MWLHMRLLENCNLRCRHCYANDRSRAAVMDFDVYKQSIDIYSGKVEMRSIDVDKRVMLSGGEPFLHRRFRDMLEYAYNKSDITHICILTNGILIPEFISYLERFKDKLKVQVSVEGGEAMDDEIRGRGHFKKAVKALDLLREYGIVYHLSYTVSKDNMEEYKNFIELAKEFGSAANNMSPYIGEIDKMLSFDEWEAFKQRVRDYGEQVNLLPPASIRCCGWTYNCASFMGGVTINPDGTLTGCARDNRVIGNYQEIDKFFINHGYFMHSTCMREKWKEDRDEIEKRIKSAMMMKRNLQVTTQTN